jgi:hypothetical protein
MNFFASFRSLMATRDNPNQTSLFVHVPPFEKISKETQIKFVKDLISKISAPNHDSCS